MNNGLLPNSSNGALRYNPVTNALVVGDADQGRSVAGQYLIDVGQSNVFNAVSGDNILVMGGQNNITGNNPSGIILGSNNTFTNVNQSVALTFGDKVGSIMLGSNNKFYANTLGGQSGDNIVIGNNAILGAPGGSSFVGQRNVLIGSGATLTSGTAVVIGAAASAGGSGVVIGPSASIGSANSMALGASSTAASTNCIAIGVNVNNPTPYSTAIQSGAKPIANSSVCFGTGYSTNYTQYEVFQLQANTTNGGTAVEATSNTFGTPRPVLGTYQMLGFTGTAVAKNPSDTTQNKVIFFKGAVVRPTSATSSTVLIGTPTFEYFGSTGTDDWTLAITADTTNGCPKFTVTTGTVNNSGTVKWNISVQSTSIL